MHQEATVVSVRERSGRVIARTVLPTRARALTDYFSGMLGSVRVAFEEGTQAEWLHDMLARLAEYVIVCNRRGEPRLRATKRTSGTPTLSPLGTAERPLDPQAVGC